MFPQKWFVWKSSGSGNQRKESPGKILVGDDDVAEEKTEVPEKLDAPVKSGTPVGQITHLLNGEKWGAARLL